MSLDPLIRERIVHGIQQLRAENRFIGKDALTRHYATFRAQFGPDALASLDGETLLSRIHEHGRQDSLVYWLEFKDDDEFPYVFGSILGGSALKFGIYRRKETGLWMTGPAMNQRVLDIDEAVVVARKHRDELVAGARLLDALSRDPAHVDYDALQERLAAIAPTVFDSAWGHKYFSLIAPELLDDYHGPGYQRFHLLKMLVAPPDGRYRSAAPYARIARELDLYPSQLSTALNHVDGDPHRWIRLGTSAGDTGKTQWPAMREGGYAAVGWNELGDLSDKSLNLESREAIKRMVAERYGSIPSAAGLAAGQIFDLVAKTRTGDLIVAMNGGRHVLGIGRVTGDYHFVAKDGEFAHRRPVEWLVDQPFDLLSLEPVPATYRDLKHVENIVAVERALRGTSRKPITARPPEPGPEPLSPMAARIETALRRKGQVILFGPPGTGKTHHAEEATRELAARSFFGRSYGQLAPDDQRRLFDVGPSGLGAIETCCFHPAYGYEDFLEGYRPHANAGGLGFELRDGVFKRVCQRAAAQPEREFFLIIDEINRGDVPRIFGELLTVLEKSRRGREIVLPVSATPFAVPPNVFVIGTMNTADRSIALLDAALRRRFGFIELMPSASVLGGAALRGIPLGPWLDALNRRVIEHVGRDARNLQVGHSYLLDGSAPLKDFARFKEVLRDEILPLLEEYCYDAPEALHQILGDALHDRARRAIRYELFAAGHEEALAQALLKPAPDIVASSAAVQLDSDTEDAEADDPEADDRAS